VPDEGKIESRIKISLLNFPQNSDLFISPYLISGKIAQEKPFLLQDF